MIVSGSDTHKSSRSFAADDAASGEPLRKLTVGSTVAAVDDAPGWVSGPDGDRACTIEACLDVSRCSERRLVLGGECTVGFAPRLMVIARRSARERGRRDSLNETGVARPPARRFDTRALAIRLLLDQYDGLVQGRSDELHLWSLNLHELVRVLDEYGEQLLPPGVEGGGKVHPPRRFKRARGLNLGGAGDGHRHDSGEHRRPQDQRPDRHADDRRRHWLSYRNRGWPEEKSGDGARGHHRPEAEPWEPERRDLNPLHVHSDRAGGGR